MKFYYPIYSTFKFMRNQDKKKALTEKSKNLQKKKLVMNEFKELCWKLR